MKISLDEREPIVKECIGCPRIDKMLREGIEIDVCKVYLYPASRWGLKKKCLLATHIEVEEEKGKKKIVRRKQKKKKKK